MKKRFVLCCFLVGLALSTSFSQSTVFIVRDAEKADDSKNAELSEAGRARAEALAKMRRDSKIAKKHKRERSGKMLTEKWEACSNRPILIVSPQS